MFFEFADVVAAFTPLTLAVMFLAVFGGLVVSVLPGLTSTMAVALLVPFTFGMTVELGLVMLVAVYIGGITGGFVAATLLNIPGGPASVATVLDAYPMAQRGDAGKALALGVIGSFFGSFLSFFSLAFVAPIIGAFALKFGPAEYFALIVFTLTCIIAISRESMLKGLIAACIGLLLGTIGLSDTDGIPRFTFNLQILRGGFEVMPVLIGMYTVSQLLGEIKRIKQPIEFTFASFTMKEFWEMVKFYKQCYKNALRSAGIGIGIGFLPGIGPGLANIVSYSQAKAAAEDPDSFGKGNPNGVIATETSNNASTGASMIPLLTLGIPGCATTMMMLGAFMIHGIAPGPLLFRDHGTLMGIVIVSYLISTFFMLIIQLQFINVLIKALAAPRHLLYPGIMALCAIGTYALNTNMDNIWIFLVMGLLGTLFVKLGYPLLPLVIGLILGRMLENNLRTTLVMGHGSLTVLLDRPIAMVFLVAAALSLIISLYTLRRSRTPST